MIVVGCDFGAMAAKVVVMNDGSIVSTKIGAVRPIPGQVASDVLDKALSEAGLSSADVDHSVSTGCARRRVPFAKADLGEMLCLAKGAQWLVPSARTVIDVGGESSGALTVSEAGRILDCSMNDKCAAGTGKLLERMAEALELTVEGLASLAFQSRNPAKISSQCCVFAQSEVIALVNEGRELSDIVAGVHDSIVSRLATVVGRIRIAEDVVMTGGCAKNKKLVEGLENHLSVRMKPLPLDPQLVAATGAALYARGNWGLP
jgi:predicted CoA-substrate-specific enzyme activase